jgi:hypothetical protein
MLIPFRQGLIAAGSNYLKADSGYADLVSNSVPIIADAVAGEYDYLVREYISVPQAWGPFTGTATQYLYWDINVVTGAQTRGFTANFTNNSSSTPPASPVLNQMWFSAATTGSYNGVNFPAAFVWNGTAWVQVIRVLAGLWINGAIETLNSPTPGSGYVNGTYTNVPLSYVTSGAGVGATANITVAGGSVTVVSINLPGYGYNLADNLTTNNAFLGGTGSGFAITVAAIQMGVATEPVASQAIPPLNTTASAGFVFFAQGIQGLTGAPGPGVAPGGTPGQILVKNSNSNYDTSWQTVGGTGTVVSVGAASLGGNAAALTITGSPITSAGIIDFTLNTFSSTTPGVVTASGGGTANFLRADGAWAAPPGGGGGGGPTVIVTTTNVTIAANDYVIADTTAGPFTITLPSSPTQGMIVYFVDGGGTWETNNLTINGNGANILGSSSTLIASLTNDNFSLIYYDLTRGWILGA